MKKPDYQLIDAGGIGGGTIRRSCLLTPIFVILRLDPKSETLQQRTHIPHGKLVGSLNISGWFDWAASRAGR
jgi:hypothetical protein